MMMMIMMIMMMVLVMMMLFECARRRLFSFTIPLSFDSYSPIYHSMSSSSSSSFSGKSFLQFSKVLNMKLEVVDPSLYIHRYDS